MSFVCIGDTGLCGPDVGGPNYFAVALAGFFVKRDFNTHVVLQGMPDPKVANALHGTNAVVTGDLWHRHDLPEQKAYKLATWLNTKGPGLFIASNSIDVCWLALPLLQPQIRVLSVAHHDVDAYYKPVAYYADFIDRAVGVSQQITKKLASTQGIGTNKAKCIPYSTECLSSADFQLKAARIGGRTLEIGYVGRLIEAQKRVSRFPLLLDKLAGLNIDFRFNFVGDGPDRKRLESAISESIHASKVVFHGWKAGDELSSIYNRLDIIVFVSDLEGTPISMLEAMGSGVAPIVPNINTGMTEVVQDGVNGMVVPPGDLDSYATRILALSSDAKLLGKLQQGAWTTGLRYNLEAMGKAYLDEYNGLVNGFRTTSSAACTYPVMPSCRSRFPYWIRSLKSRVCKVFDAR